jgi:hypothetical protein
MKPSARRILWGVGITAVLFAFAVGFLVLTAIGDVAFYTLDAMPVNRSLWSRLVAGDAKTPELLA